MPDTLLPCGASARTVADEALDDAGGRHGGHGRSCPHCTAVRRDRRAQWAEVAAALSRPAPPPRGVRLAVLRRVRPAGPAHRIPLASDGPGRTVVAADVLADLTARAAATPSGVAEVTDVRVAATDAGPVDLSVELTGQLDWSQPLAQVAESVRHEVGAHLWAMAGVRVGRVEVVIGDLRGLPRAPMDQDVQVARDTSGTAGV